MEPETKKRKKSRFFPGLIIGIVLGAVGMTFVPQWAETYLPASLQTGDSVDGEVLEKSSEPERLLLKLATQQGVVLATFTERIEEIDLLVESGDVVTLNVSRYQPFLDNPAIQRVRKPETAFEEPREPEPVKPEEPLIGEPQEEPPLKEEEEVEEAEEPAPEKTTTTVPSS